MASDEDDDKQFEPSQKKLDDARKKGEIAKSADLSTAASYGGLLLIFIAFGSGSLSALGTVLSNLIAKSDEFSSLLFHGGASVVTGSLISATLAAIGSWFLIPALAALLAILAQRSLIFAPEKLLPKLSHISLVANAKNKFGRNGVFEFFKSFFKLLVYSALLWFFLLSRITTILETVHQTPAMITVTLAQLMIEFLFIILVISTLIGAVDYLWQVQEHQRRNRMSRKEMLDESKQQEGDPHIKQQRRQKGYTIAMNQMLTNVPDADVIVVNPKHYAVALKWDKGSGTAPVCVAKGVDEIAARIREVAIESAVPIHRDPPTARAIFATVELGQEVLPQQYQAVAAAIRFAEMIRQKAKGARAK